MKDGTLWSISNDTFNNLNMIVTYANFRKDHPDPTDPGCADPSKWADELEDMLQEIYDEMIDNKRLGR